MAMVKQRALSIILIHLSPLALFVRTTGAFTHRNHHLHRHHHHHHHHRHRHRRQHSVATASTHHHHQSHPTTPTTTTTATTTTTTTNNQSLDDDMWDPASQTYKNGIVPSHPTSISIEDLLASNDGTLRIFGYGSLCWHPGSDGVLSLANLEDDDDDDDATAAADGKDTKATTRSKVSTMPGKAIGYQRCWSQRSADHRGTTDFNGIVCTLLSDEEVGKLHHHRPTTTTPTTSTTAEEEDVGIGDDDDDDDERLIVRRQRPSMTEGLIYTVDVDLVEDCLAELDFREKGGYARDVIDVVEDDTGNTVQALLYRGTPDNPAFWKRVLLDLPLAAAIISVAIGPSGPNDIYLLHLHSFLAQHDAASHHSPSLTSSSSSAATPTTTTKKHASSSSSSEGDHSGDTNTGELAAMVKLLQSEYRPYFLFGAGSNEHGQLLLPGSASGGGVVEDNAEAESEIMTTEVDELTELLLVAPRAGGGNGETANDTDLSSAGDVDADPHSLHAGGGHSALLTRGGDLYLWGWNDAGQLGRCGASSSTTSTKSSGLDPVHPLSNVRVATVDLGHAHTLVVEKGTGRLFGFGENGRGRVDGFASAVGSSATANKPPQQQQHALQTPLGLSKEHFVDVAAGLFHSAGVTQRGELVTWGCGRFGQCLVPTKVQNVTTQDGLVGSSTAASSSLSTVGRWHPADGSKLVQVACGRRHTVALDEHGRVWTLGDNKYGQLGRRRRSEDATNTPANAEPQLVEGPLGKVNSRCFAIRSGWSHILALVRSDNDSGGGGGAMLYGWGRNDKGQLGVISTQSHVPVPQILKPTSNAIGSGERLISIQSACCGAESSHVLDVDGNLHSAGWNEHGNLAIGVDGGSGRRDCCLSWTIASGVRVVAPPSSKAERKLFAAGGAHLITMVT